MQRILERLLLIEHSPAGEQRLHWADAIAEFRDQLERKLSPTIRRRLKRESAEAFARARRRVQRKTERHGEARAAAALPPECPYTLERLLGDWLPAEDSISPA